MTNSGRTTSPGGSRKGLLALLGAEDPLAQILEGSVQTLERERTLQLTGEATSSVLVVLDGWLSVSKSTEDGQQQIVDFVLPGEYFDPGSATSAQASVDLSALTQVKVAIVARSRWRDQVETRPDMQRALDRHASAAYARIAERLLRVGQSHAESRIAYALCELYLRTTDKGLVNGRAFHLPLTQQILGDFVGLSSVHVSRTLRRLRQRKVIETGDHMDVRVHDVDSLAEIAEVDLADLRARIIPQT